MTAKQRVHATGMSYIWKFLIRGWRGPSKSEEGLCQKLHEVYGICMYSRVIREDGATVGVIEFNTALDETVVDIVMSDMFPSGTYEVGFWEPTVPGDRNFDYDGWRVDHRRVLRTQVNCRTCCLCDGTIQGYGNNAQPAGTGRACDECNMDVVIPARLTAKYVK